HGPAWPTQRPLARSITENMPKPCSIQAPGCCRKRRQAAPRGAWPPMWRAASSSPRSSANRSKSPIRGTRSTSRSVSMTGPLASMGPPLPSAARRAGSERVDAGELAAHHQLVHGLRALVGDHRLEVERVADRAVLGGDAGATEQVARLARDVDGHAAVVPLGQRDLGGLHLPGVLEAAELEAQQLRGGDAARPVGHLDLGALGRGHGAPEENALL